jgi:hypothetical protein
MNKSHSVFLNALAVLFVLAAFLALPFTVWYNWERNVWDLQTIVHNTSYTTGDTVTFTSVFQTYAQQDTTFTNRFVCRNGVEKRKLLDTRFVQIPAAPLAEADDSFVVPEGIVGHSCTLENTASSCVNIGLGLKKCIVEVTNSNEFSIH